MPYIQVNVSNALTKEKATKVKEELGRIIELIPGKSETFLMVQLLDDCELYFGGNQDGETAYVKVESFGSISDENCELLTQELCSMMTSELGIPENRIYITYEGITQWGWNGKNF